MRDFPSTEWTRLERSRSTEEWNYDWFYRTYKAPVAAYLASRLPKDDVDDVLQEFFTRIVLQRGLIERADRQKGSLRGLIAAALDRFLSDHWRRMRTKKRGSGIPPLQLSDPLAQGGSGEVGGLIATPVTPDLAFDRAWSAHIMARAMAATCDDCAKRGKQALFDAVAGELDGSAVKRSRSELGAELGMTARAVTLAISDLKQRLASHFMEEVARTVGPDACLESELRALREALRQ